MDHAWGWCRLGGAGGGRGAPQGCPGVTTSWESRWPKTMAHTQPWAPLRHSAPMAYEPTRAGVGLGHPVARCLASTGRRGGGWVYSEFQMAEDLADHFALRDDGDES